MFTGFVKAVPVEIEEAALIDGCNPLQTYFLVVFPMMKPTTVTVAILQAMWVWNDYLLPCLVLNINKYRTIPIAIQFLKQSHGQLDWGAMMAALVLAILPIVIFYIAGQKYIIEGVLTGAVKG
jgi:raffinose/stachyose/melibiose transport system permease protein